MRNGILTDHLASTMESFQQQDGQYCYKEISNRYKGHIK